MVSCHLFGDSRHYDETFTNWIPLLSHCEREFWTSCHWHSLTSRRLNHIPVWSHLHSSPCSLQAPCLTFFCSPSSLSLKKEQMKEQLPICPELCLSSAWHSCESLQNPTWALLPNRLSRGCTSCAGQEATSYRSCWPSSVQPLLSVLTTWVTVWFSSATSNEQRLLWVFRSAEKLIGSNLPPHQDMFFSRAGKWAEKNHYQLPAARPPRIQTSSLQADASDQSSSKTPNTGNPSFYMQLDSWTIYSLKWTDARTQYGQKNGLGVMVLLA